MSTQLHGSAPAENAKQYLDNREAHAYLGLAYGTMDVWRCTGRYKLPYYRVGRKIQYRRSDLDAWLESRRVVPTGSPSL